jgi:ABC-2 type transport system ATP-binding protein
MTVAEVESVTKRFGEVVALDRLTLSADAGSTIALLGANGAGKTTLISLLLGLRTPDGGRVRVLGGDPRAAAVRSSIGTALQDVGLPATLRADELVRFVAAHFANAAPVGELLARFGLDRVAMRQAGGLSGGQRRRLALALAFAGRPPLVILDEPTASLDPDGRSAVWAAVEELRRDGGTILVATHDLHEAEAVADRVVVLDAGRVVADGSPRAIAARAGTTRIAYVGERAPPGFPDARCARGRVVLDADDAGAAVTRLVQAGVDLHGLEVRPLSLDEAIARLQRGLP